MVPSAPLRPRKLNQPGGCKTLFVCYAESPKELADKSPALSAKLGEGAALSPAKDDGLARP